MIRKSREIPNEKTQIATCHLPINTYKMSTTTALKSHTATLPPSFNNSGCSVGVSCLETGTAAAAAAMSSLAADICKAATTKQVTPPTEAAVVVNSIIYSKPSFCSIVVDIGGTDTPTAKATGTGHGTEKFSRINKPALPLPTQTAGNEGVFPLPPTDNQNDAHVYMMCTTMNGSVHHHISEMCDSLIAMGLFGMETNSEPDDDDSLIEFAYDDTDEDEDGIEFLRTDEDYKGHDVYNDDEEESEDDDDDEDEEEDYDSDDNNNVEDYETEDEDACRYAGKDVTDCPRWPGLLRAPVYNYEKQKKVRFDTKPTVHVMRTWDYAYRAARKGEWEMYARDRERFKLRIQRTALTLNPILDREHRLKVYEQRFAPLYVEQGDEKANDTPQPKKIKQKQKHRKKRRKRRRPNF